ncbi:MAG: hypothetical protein EAY65_04580 [Alphaproteobacteria bacterium]|jgi:hypothetical protein|nr:MAG: hypothetical protein EAY65_04580 [Alphaproteobacteria bacterium]
MISFVRGFLLGMVSAFSFPSAPLYRYPYFFPYEAMRGDWLRIGGDVDASIQEFIRSEQEST